MYKIAHVKKSYICTKCQNEEPLEENRVINRARKNDDKIIVIGKKEQELKTLPTTKAKCPKCNNDIAYWWMVQTRGLDESTTQFYRCTKCGYTWREYS